jgi:NAD(P)-dependent dehydrogenase (short-subunit alcohol dehydrogenase family)
MTPGRDVFDLGSRIVVVTGGLGRLGTEFTIALAERGARVVALDASAAPARLADRLRPLLDEGRVRAVEADVTSRGSLETALASIERAWGVPSGLVNAAAIDSPPDAPAAENGPVETYPESSFARVMDVNVKGVLLACQVFGGAMARAGCGSIVNICSTYGLVSPDQGLYAYRRERGETFYKPISYSISKSALLNLTRHLATYWGPRGVRVNTLSPGGVHAGQERAFVEAYERRTPLGRMARADEYNGAIVFLLSDASSYMTGANLVVDGGWTAW